jgi:hypothetical protein
MVCMSTLVQLLRSRPGSCIRAKALAERHRPFPEQSFGHLSRSQACPSNLTSHLQLPMCCGDGGKM